MNEVMSGYFWIFRSFKIPHGYIFLESEWFIYYIPRDSFAVRV